MKSKNPYHKFLVFIIFIILIINIFFVIGIYAQELFPIQRPSSTTTPSTGTGTDGLVPIQKPGADTSTTPPLPTNSDPVSVPSTAKEPAQVGNKVLQKPDGTSGDAKDVKVKGGTVTPDKFVDGKSDGGKITFGGKGEVDGKKDVDLGTEGEATIKRNEIKKAGAGSSVEIDKNGRIKEEKISGVATKDGKGTEVVVDGRDKKVTMGVPEGATLTKQPGVDFTLTMSEKGGKLEMPKVEKKKPEEEDKEGYNPNFRILSEQAYTQIPDELSKKAGLSSGLSFKTGPNGALIFNSDGTFRTQGTVTFATPGSDGKLMTVKNLGETYNNANKESVLFFGKESTQTSEAKELIKEGVAGVVIDANQKFMSSFSTNDKLGAYVELGDKNPFNGYRSAVMPEAKSGVSVFGGSERPEVRIQGDGLFYAGEGIGYKKQGNDLMFKQDAKISDIFGNNIESFESSKDYRAKILPLDNSGNYIQEPSKRLYIDSGISNDGKLISKAIVISPGGTPVLPAIDPGRVEGNLPAVGSNPATNINPGAAAPVTGLDAKSFIPDRNTGGYSGIEGDVLSHAKPGAENQGMTEIGPGGSRTITTKDTDPSTGTHELEHDVNSRLRNDKGYRGYWGFYTGNNEAVYIKEFDSKKVNVDALRTEVPLSLQGDRYKSYIATDKYAIISYGDGRTEKTKINDVLTVFDEIWAYNMGSKAGLETGQGHITGHSDFASISLSTAKVLSERDPSYWNSQDGVQFKSFLGRSLQESMSLLNQGASRADPEQMRILQNLRTSPDAENLREFARQTYTPEWTKKVFGF